MNKTMINFKRVDNNNNEINNIKENTKLNVYDSSMSDNEIT